MFAASVSGRNRITPGLSSISRVPRGTGAVKRVRMSHNPSGNLRLVLDLTQPVQAKSFLSAPNAHYGYRLVVDLAAASRTAASRAGTSRAGTIRAATIRAAG